MNALSGLAADPALSEIADRSSHRSETTRCAKRGHNKSGHSAGASPPAHTRQYILVEARRLLRLRLNQ
jgi:hypothetical protein